jgi:hypothetical protein
VSSVEPRRDSSSRNRKSFQTAAAPVLAMMDYFKPLMSWLEEQNKGRQLVGLASAERRTPAMMCASTSTTRQKRCLANSASADEQLRGL